MSNLLTTVGLCLDIIGVILLLNHDPGRGMSIRNSEGKEFLIPGGSQEERRTGPRKAALGGYLIIAGFLFQIVAQWV